MDFHVKGKRVLEGGEYACRHHQGADRLPRIVTSESLVVTIINFDFSLR